jgi:hypothetical protein
MGFYVSSASAVTTTGLRCLLFAIVIIPWHIGAISFGDDSAPTNHHDWVTDAESLIHDLNDLSKLARTKPERWDAAFQSDNHGRRADKILWRLWLTTGMPPLTHEPEKTFDAYLRQNARVYRRYIAEHRELTLEELHRRGLTNATESFGSPLWYMTLRYLAEKASVKSDWHIELRTTPTYFLAECPLDKEAYSRQSTAFARWLEANKEQMVWDANTKRFHPRNGEYVGTDGLFQALMQSVAGKEGEEKEQPATALRKSNATPEETIKRSGVGS